MKLLFAVFISVAVLLGAIFLPWAQLIFGTVTLGRDVLLVSAAFSMAVPLVASVFRLFEKKKD